ncbi:MAG: Ig-like domain-containing protein, partial [Elusimicrobia bacterium]|nr:Ig-like domain-containing protein [Elusimicrobiota bacterium]
MKRLPWLSLLVLVLLGSASAAHARPPVRNLRSTTWYNFQTGFAENLEDLEREIPKIKAAGFNALWLVNAWYVYDSSPLASPRVYKEDAFNHLKAELDILRDNDMQAFIGLNYLGTGWEPKGISFCPGWVEDQNSYNAFKEYVVEFSTRIWDYSDMVHLLFFTEAAEPCRFTPSSATYWANGADPALAAEVADIARSKLGNLPNELPPDIRNHFSFGYHDYTLINWGLVDGDHLPIASASTFDFLSMVVYFMDDLADSQIADTVSQRAGRFRTFFPSLPLIVGESGAKHCTGSYTPANQSRVLTAIESTALDLDLGLNVWAWLSLPGECTTPTSGRYAITQADGTFYPAVDSLTSLFKPRPASGVVVTSWDPWAVSVSGKNLNAHIKARLSDQGGAAWGGDIGTTIASDYTWLSFQLPSNVPPSGCNISGPCNIDLVLVDTMSNLTSDSMPLTLPQAPDATPPEVSLSTPADGAVVSGFVAVRADASDNLAVSSVVFLVDGAVKSTDTSPPYTFSWNTNRALEGRHDLSVKAYDFRGNNRTSVSVSVTVNNNGLSVSTMPAATSAQTPPAPDVTPPTVSLAALE